MKKIFTKLRLPLLLVVALTMIYFGPRTRIYAETVLDKPRVSITFDDGYASTYNNALPILSNKGVKATVFVTTSYIGQEGNLTWDQLVELQNTYGWEIGNHSINHLELPLLTLAEMRTEINKARNTLTNKGLNVTSFASPFGAYNNDVLIQAAKNHNLHRGYWERGYLNTYPYERTVIATKSVDSGVTVSQVKAWVDQAVTENKWLVLVFHEVQPELDPNYFYTTTLSDFTEIVEYISSSSVEPVLPNHTLQKPGTNLFTSTSFQNGITEGWSTDSQYILLNTGNNGNYPSPKEAILLRGNTNPSHLFSNAIKNISSSSYLFEAFVNANSLKTGEMGFYMDEYDSSGNWVSGQWLGSVEPNIVTHFNRRYTPTSSSVDTFSLQTYIDGGSTGRVFVDNYEIYNLDNGDATPIPEPPPTPEPEPEPTPPPPTTNNLLSNGSFETLSGGWASNWSRDNEGFVVDTNSKGNDGTNSLHTTTNLRSHTFSEKIPVTYGSQYVWTQYVNVQYTSGEFGYYIDEYDADGNWISGQWKAEISSNFLGQSEISYSPTSSNVKTIGLQYYLTGGSNLTLFLDSVNFYKK